MGIRWVAAAAWAAVAVLFAVTATTGCSAEDESISDGVYLSTPESTFPLVPGSSVRMRIVEGRISINAGCNTLNGAYSVRNGQLRVTTLASTRIGCPAPLADQDQALEQFLTSSPRVDIAGNGFTLTDDTGLTLVLADSGESPAAL